MDNFNNYGAEWSASLSALSAETLFMLAALQLKHCDEVIIESNFPSPESPEWLKENIDPKVELKRFTALPA